jgi:hypothetical protein
MRAMEEKGEGRTAGLVGKVDVAALTTLREGQVGIMLRKKSLSVMPSEEAWWVGTALWFWKTL